MSIAQFAAYIIKLQLMRNILIILQLTEPIYLNKICEKPVKVGAYTLADNILSTSFLK